MTKNDLKSKGMLIETEENDYVRKTRRMIEDMVIKGKEDTTRNWMYIFQNMEAGELMHVLQAIGNTYWINNVANFQLDAYNDIWNINYEREKEK